MSRALFLMLDGVGAGELPDSADYGDAGSDTLGNLARAVDLTLPTFQRLGLGNILPLQGVPPVAAPLCLPGRLAPLSAGKDTTVGHWEHMGLITERPFPTYPDGFPEEILTPFRERIGRGVLGNKPASGTAIIAELGEEHLRTGWPIVYTSADSVFQIAAHVGIVPLEQLYEWCETARGLLTGPHAVARVIARPFTGEPGAFTRTKDRRDFSLAPPRTIYLDLLHEAGVPVLALGKISEVFLGRGVTAKVKVASNDDNLALILDLLAGTSSKASFDEGLLFTNLVDFDMVWGHRNDAEGFARGLEAVDRALPAILALLGPDDLLIITADHGVDPTTTSTDHSREYVPLLLHPRPPAAPAAVYEGFFSDTGATVYAHLMGGARGGAVPGTGSAAAAPQPGARRGTPVAALQPARGWRRYTPVLWAHGFRDRATAVLDGPAAVVPVRVGPEEAREAAAWLRERFGVAPRWAVVLGSGLAEAMPEGGEGTWSVTYSDIPHWRTSRVAGHPGTLSLGHLAGEPVLLLRGRAHEYEGFDVSEVQLPVRTLAAWGVEGLVVTSAAGAVASALGCGDLVLVDEIIDLHRPPALTVHRMAGSDPDAIADLPAWGRDVPGLKAGTQADLPGPQYETRTEIEVLAGLGADCVSMSLAAEAAAAREEGLRLVAFAVITNAGPPTHEEVLAGGASASGRLARALAAVIAHFAKGASAD